MKKYHIITYGCQMNVHESEKLAGILINSGYENTSDIRFADIIILNTCCIRESAENHIYGNLGQIKKLKEQNRELKVAVCGCMTQKDNAADKLLKRCPFVNIVFGTHNLHKFSDYLKSLNSGKRIVEIMSSSEGIVENLPIHRSSGINAWVNIMYGCDNFCTYCIVPYVRGRERSRKIENIISDIKSLIGEGYKEITLLGQNVNSYGNDQNSCDISFAILLDRIAQIDGKFRVKFMTSHPKDLSEDVVKIIADSQKLSKFIHLPVQAGSDRILSLMNRKYSAKDYLNKIDIIRKYIPNVGLSSDIMVGFPSETENDFLDTLNLIKTVRFNNLYTFIYSRRSGTKADLMSEQVSNADKKSRIKRLIDEQFVIGNELASKCVDKTFEVLCDAQEGVKLKGKTDCNKIVSFNSIDNENYVGKYINVKITKSKNSNLTGEIQV